MRLAMRCDAKPDDLAKAIIYRTTHIALGLFVFKTVRFLTFCSFIFKGTKNYPMKSLG